MGLRGRSGIFFLYAARSHVGSVTDRDHHPAGHLSGLG
jgi:hypothetical protein